MVDVQAVLDFVEEIGVLKNLPRTGWRARGIKEAESIADHCYRVTLLAMCLADLLSEQGVALDVEKVLRMALLHEIGEARIGDVPSPALAYIPADVKQAGERAAVEGMLAGFGAFRQLYVGLWEEFERGTSLEGKLVRAADKLEMLMQALAYEKIGYRSLGEFWEHLAQGRYDFGDFPALKEMVTLLVERRAALPK